MSEPKTVDPCLSLEIQSDGAVLLTVAAQLRPGALNWTPAEAGLWFARSWQRAEQALATVTIHRALEQGQVCLIAQGDHTWRFTAAPEPAVAAAAPIIAAPVAPPVTPTVATITQQEADDKEEKEEEATITIGDEQNPVEQPAMFNGPESLLSVPAPRIAERAAETADQKRVIRHLNKALQPLSVADLCKQADLTTYRVRKALDGLLDKQLIHEEKVPSRGRYKEMAVYSGAVREVTT